jgi:hypothetical protein
MYLFIYKVFFSLHAVLSWQKEEVSGWFYSLVILHPGEKKSY